MHLLARARMTLARHPSIYWVALTLVSAVVALGVAHALASVDAARRSWGEQRSVWIATATIEPGQPVTAVQRDVPVAVVPVEAVVASVSG
ncbi:MAG TPA: hypothetical protein VGC84_08905, partial [Ilumatobacteraceae bacterium]